MVQALSVPSLFQLGYYWEAKIFLTSVKLDLYTPLAEGPMTADALAAAVEADPSCLERMLDALVSIGLLQRNAEGYANIPQLAEFLVKTSRFYMGELMLLQDAEWDHWGKLENIIRTGRPAVSGNIFMNRPEIGATVLSVLDRMAKRVAPGLAERIDFSRSQNFIDIGGGAATFSIAFCKRYPHLKAVLFDLPQTLPVASANIRNAGLEERISLVPGNFNRDPLPGRFDTVFLSDILHYQTAEENAALIQKLYHATQPGGSIVVKDMLIDSDDSRPGWNAVFSIHMMVYSEKGRCFKEDAVATWLEKAGFQDITKIERNTVMSATRPL
ncbi:MAG: methyltransferase [Nitrospiria bacterium]